MAEMTTSTGFTCPTCKKDIEITTKGLFGGIFQQMLFNSFLNRLREQGGTIKHEPCGTVIKVPGK